MDKSSANIFWVFLALSTLAVFGGTYHMFQTIGVTVSPETRTPQNETTEAPSPNSVQLSAAMELHPSFVVGKKFVGTSQTDIDEFASAGVSATLTKDTVNRFENFKIGVWFFDAGQQLVSSHEGPTELHLYTSKEFDLMPVAVSGDELVICTSFVANGSELTRLELRSTAALKRPESVRSSSAAIVGEPIVQAGITFDCMDKSVGVAVRTLLKQGGT